MPHCLVSVEHMSRWSLVFVLLRKFYGCRDWPLTLTLSSFLRFWTDPGRCQGQQHLCGGVASMALQTTTSIFNSVVADNKLIRTDYVEY